MQVVVGSGRDWQRGGEVSGREWEVFAGQRCIRQLGAGPGSPAHLLRRPLRGPACAATAFSLVLERISFPRLSWLVPRLLVPVWFRPRSAGASSIGCSRWLSLPGSAESGSSWLPGSSV